MSTTAAVIAANQENAQFSTGPRTPEGRKRSAANAIKNGLFSESPVLPGEDPAPYEAFRQQFHADLQPKNLLEEQLVNDLANVRWRINRCQSIENGILSDETMSASEQIDCLSRYSLYEQRLTRKFTQTFKQFQAIQAERKAQEERDMEYAVAIAAECKASHEPFTAAAFGFVFSDAEIAIRLNRHERLESARAHGLFTSRTRQRAKIAA